jgi:hypothetical protein
MGKNIAKTGVRIVPSPNPEKNVSIAAPKATSEMIKYSIRYSRPIHYKDR